MADDDAQKVSKENNKVADSAKGAAAAVATVSYTHLTLPTICSV